MSVEGLRAAQEKMRAAGLHEASIRGFARAYERLEAAESGLLAGSELEPVAELPTLASLPEPETGDAGVLDSVVVIRLNGGLGTSMGVQRPKSLIEARGGMSFLDVIARQILAVRERFGVRLPLLLMNSFATREPTLAALARHPQLPSDLPPDFLQGKEPKLRADDLEPVSWPRQPELEWCPPGHGDIYTALLASGLLEEMLERGYRYAFVANSDNLGAVVEPRIASHMDAGGIPFLMEVVRGTEADRKGGHIARRLSDGRLVLRETAQTPPEEIESFSDFRRWRYYNTNNLWIDLRTLRELVAHGDGAIELPLIVNRKAVDPRDRNSTPVIQLESAMGAAIGSFPGARALEVPRVRFAPVRTTDDLLLLRSDVYRLGADMTVEPLASRRDRLPFVDLDRRVYALLDDFEARFPAGPPSLAEAERLVVRGDVTFAAGVVVRGAVTLDDDGRPPVTLAPGTLLDERFTLPLP
jgi:UTP--glucose-1-phosphate uridylyltransferase